MVAPASRFRARLAARLQQRWPARRVQLTDGLSQAAALTQERIFGLLIVADIGRYPAAASALDGLCAERPAQPLVVLRTAEWGAVNPLPPSPPHLLLSPAKSTTQAVAALSPWLEGPPMPWPPAPGWHPASATPAGFTARELDVLRRIANDETSEEIAQALFVTPRTVEYHRRMLAQKAGTRTLAGLVARAIRAGWIA